MADQVLVDAVPRIDLANLIEELKTKNRESLLEAVEAYQERLLDELCGKKRKPNGTYRRAGSGRRLKTIVTTLGVVRFRTLKVKNHATGETLTPILDILDVRGRKYTRQVKAQCAELTSKLSYGDTREEYHRLTGLRVPYTTNQIERLMGEIAKRCKHKWMHWSTEGLENILQIILVRYTNPQLYKQFWKTYIHPSQYQPTLTTPT